MGRGRNVEVTMVMLMGDHVITHSHCITLLPYYITALFLIYDTALLHYCTTGGLIVNTALL